MRRGERRGGKSKVAIRFKLGGRADDSHTCALVEARRIDSAGAAEAPTPLRCFEFSKDGGGQLFEVHADG
eukprot:6192606-Pleurochrysis_carterae.AAC.3